jgi:hypothetical protein
VDFDALRAAVVPGAAVVGRWPGVICVAECADRHVLRQLLEVCASASGGEPGRTLARRLAGWLGGSDAPGDGLRFGTVAVTGGDSRARGEQWAVFLYGPVGLVVPDRQVALSGAQSVAWTDRLLPRPDAPVVLALEGGPIPPGVVDGVHDLRAGVVPAAGVVLVPGGDDRSADAADELGRNRADDPRWPDAGPADRPRWAPEPSAAPAEGLFPGDTPGNGVPSRTSFDTIDGGYGRYEGGDPERTNGNGRAHLRPVPSNGVAHRGWAPRRGSLDVDRDQDAAEQRRGRRGEDEPTEAAPPRSERPEERRLPPEHDDPRGPETTTSPSIGDDLGAEHGIDGPGIDRPHDDRPRNGLNGHRTNGAAYNLLGGAPEPAPREAEPERSPWSDGRDLGRPDRIEGWFATRDDSGTESDLSAVGPTELRRRRHGRPEDDAAHDDEPAAETSREGADVEQGDRRSGDQGEFGSGSGEDDRVEPADRRPHGGVSNRTDSRGGVSDRADRADPDGGTNRGDTNRGDVNRGDVNRVDFTRADFTPADFTRADPNGGDPTGGGSNGGGLNGGGANGGGLNGDGPDRTGVDRTGLNRANPNRAGLDRAGRDRTDPNRAGLNRADLNRGDPDRSDPPGAGPHGGDAHGAGANGAPSGGDPSGGDAIRGDLDGSGDGTPRLGVPRAAEVAPEQDPHATLVGVEPPHTTALRSEQILGVAPGEVERPALDDGPATGGLAVDARPDEPQVHGYLCGRGHLNDPRAQFCGMCGMPMDEQPGPPTLGPRPPLGLLVFDDGATYTVDAEYLMGRMPEADVRVTSGDLRPLALEDTSGAVSRVHAQIVVDGWDALIVDAGSRNGTFVSPPSEQVWTQLPAGETHRLVPGTRVRIGGRSFQFEAAGGGHPGDGH